MSAAWDYNPYVTCPDDGLHHPWGGRFRKRNEAGHNSILRGEALRNGLRLLNRPLHSPPSGGLYWGHHQGDMWPAVMTVCVILELEPRQATISLSGGNLNKGFTPGRRRLLVSPSILGDLLLMVVVMNRRSRSFVHGVRERGFNSGRGLTARAARAGDSSY